jgi:integrase
MHRNRRHFGRLHNPDMVELYPNTWAPVQVTWPLELKELGIPDRDADQYRHSFTTICLHADMNPVYVLNKLGHANQRMCFHAYSKWPNGAAGERDKAKLRVLFATPPVESPARASV